jgi:hypothetical protein
MRWFALCIGLAGALGAQAPLHIVSVERRGLPPYEAADRIYGLDGGQDRGLRVGDRLIVRRTGEPTALGHLRVTEVRAERSEARYEPASATFPMKGDLALREELPKLPDMPRSGADSLQLIPPAHPSVEAPPREGVLFFLPQRVDLSPVGLKKMGDWVQAWGPGGRWAVQVPTAKALKPASQKQRAESLKAALRALGVDQVKVETDPRTTEGRYDPAWVRHWD